jgi:hypothetical protein
VKLWRREAHVDVPVPRGEAPDDSPTEGELARIKAEHQLAEEMERTRRVREVTQEIEATGARWKRIYDENHIRRDLHRTLGRA